MDVARARRRPPPQYADRDALLVREERLTFGELDRLSNAFARDLRRRGVAAGERVVVMTANRPEFVIAVYAISKLGAAAVLVSPAWKSREVGHALRDHRAASCDCRRGTAQLLRAAAGNGCGSSMSTILDPGRGGCARGSAAAPDPGPVARATRPSWSSAPGRPACPRRSATPTLHRARRRLTGWRRSASAPDDRFQVATPPSHILGLLNLLAAAAGRAPPCGCIVGSTSTRCCAGSRRSG